MTRNISFFRNKFSGDNLFFTSNTHFFHEGIIKFCNRHFESVEEMNETLIQNWNTVAPEDGTVFHLGDLTFGGWREWMSAFNRLNGNIYLILGNHDMKNAKQGFMDRFEHVSQQMSISVDWADSILGILLQEDMVGFRPWSDNYMDRNGIMNQVSLPYIWEIPRKTYWMIIKNTKLRKQHKPWPNE